MGPQLQKQVTVLYEILEQNSDFKEIHYWFVNTDLGQNDNFIRAKYQLGLQMKEVRKELNQFSESLEKLQELTDDCYKIISLERKKKEKFEKHYEKYYKKTDEIKKQMHRLNQVKLGNTKEL